MPLHKSLVHPHLGKYVLFSALKQNRTRKKLRIKMIKGAQGQEAFRCSKGATETYKTTWGMGKADQD